MGQKSRGWGAEVVKGALLGGIVAGLLWVAVPARGQMTLSPVPKENGPGNLLTNPVSKPGVALLFRLDREFSDTTAKGGGKAFASWFAEDGVTLGDGRPPVEGQGAIAAVATWSPKDYRLTWKVAGARMSPDGDYGFTWGTYTGVVTGEEGGPKTGRYILVWKRQEDGQWKVELDASNTGPAKDDCCRLP
jgi:uncharacterized protein (TIGR02246 family)